YIQNIRVVERQRKLVHQLLSARITMRLEDNNRSPPAGTIFCRLERGKDLGRMMAVIIDNGDAVDLTLELEPSVGVLELRKSIGDHREWYFELKRNSRRRQRVIHIVLAGNRQI